MCVVGEGRSVYAYTCICARASKAHSCCCIRMKEKTAHKIYSAKKGSGNCVVCHEYVVVARSCVCVSMCACMRM